MKKRFGISFFFLLLIIALALALSALEIIPQYYSSIIISWQALIVLAGLKTVLLGLYTSGALVSLTGIYFLLPHIYRSIGMQMPISSQALLTLYIASILVVIGLMSLEFSRKWLPKTSKIFEIKSKNNGKTDISCAFGEINHAFIEKPFKGAKVSTAFGQMMLNLSKTELESGDTYLEINNAFGQTIIQVPESWMVETSIQSFFGGVVDRREKIALNDSKRLIIKGANFFGGIELQSIPSYEMPSAIDEEFIETISVKQNNQVHLITLDELFYIQADGDYVTLSTTKGSFLKDQTMKYFQTVLPSDRFVRIHRSYIVNLSEISSVDCRGKETYYVLLKNGASIRASVSGYQELKQRLDI